MSNSQSQDHNRWRELHELLGIPPEQPATRFDTTAPPVQPSAVSKDMPEQDDALDAVDEDTSANAMEDDVDEPVSAERRADERIADLGIDEIDEQPVPEDQDVPIGEAPAEMPEDDDEETGPISTVEEAEPGSAEIEPADGSGASETSEEADEERPRGRRRGRRGRRGRGRREEGLAEDAPGEGEVREAGAREAGAREAGAREAGAREAAEDEAPAREDEDRFREEDEEEPRRRGRRRRGRSDEAEPARAGSDAADRERRRPAEDEDDEPVEALTDWNVPSWNEIVASLYRPER